MSKTTGAILASGSEALTLRVGQEAAVPTFEGLLIEEMSLETLAHENAGSSLAEVRSAFKPSICDTYLPLKYGEKITAC
jgi:hypothetical protein